MAKIYWMMFPSRHQYFELLSAGRPMQTGSKCSLLRTQPTWSYSRKISPYGTDGRLFATDVSANL